ncbi:translation initiation factor IF-2-like isoform X1 [Zalophus californianus]|uniref:Translation initiation factor IF-2-like isoform X1 n=1 Tax=Zalophus californianus TaxID=9704 RepID=A0A6J2FM44_ZALCA|nr:translation initiation factor IF-2-like isoform X1 [Zalophus californianus]
MAPRGEGAPSFSLARRPGRSGPRPSLASDPALRCGAARGPCTPAGAGKRGRWAGESGGAGGRGSGAEPRWREPATPKAQKLPSCSSHRMGWENLCCPTSEQAPGPRSEGPSGAPATSGTSTLEPLSR